jgi:2,3-dihydroxybenzoate-AMP ligase/mycobactin salicyl-AMP ligase
MPDYLAGFVPYEEKDALHYNRYRWWPGLTFGDILDRAADMHPEKEAFVDGRTRLTFGEAREKVDILALRLMQRGVAPKDRVLLQLPNWNEFVFAYFGLQKIGAIPVLLIDRYRQYEISHLIHMTGAVHWIVPLAYKKYDYLPIIQDIQRQHESLKNIITVRGETQPPGTCSLESLLKGEKPSKSEQDRLRAARPDPMEVAHMGPTGGTTGLPKIVPRTHNSILCGSDFCSRCWDLTSRDTVLIAGPIGHDLSFSKGFISSVLMQGKTVFLDTTDREEICRTIERERITAIVWVPTLTKMLLEYEDLYQFDLSSLKRIHSGGGASFPALIREVTEKLGCTYYNGFGSTEGITTITRTTDDLDTICGTVGRPTCPYDVYKVVDPEGNGLEQGEAGELVIKGPGIFTGYYNNPAENAAAFTPDGFFKTGDMAKFDAKGNVVLTGRIKDMINRGGESISAAEIESLIMDHPEVAAVAVVPMPDPLLGEKVCAFVQTLSNVRLTFEDVITYLKERKASVLQLPERIEFMDALPLTAANKLDKNALKARIEKTILKPKT